MTYQHDLARRQFFQGAGLRLGGVALAGLLSGRGFGAPSEADRVHPTLPGLPHFAPKAKSIIYLHMNGGPSQIDLWDYKPSLTEQFDKDLPDSIRKGQRITTMTSGQARLPVAPSKFKFEQHGQCGHRYQCFHFHSLGLRLTLRFCCWFQCRGFCVVEKVHRGLPWRGGERQAACLRAGDLQTARRGRDSMRRRRIAHERLRSRSRLLNPQRNPAG